MRRYAVIGTGAIAGLYGGRLAAAGHEVHLLARSDAQHLREHGLHVETPTEDFHVWPAVHTDVATIPPVDVVLVAIKTTANDRLPELIGPLAEQGTTVVVLQNGLGVEAVAQAAAPDAKVVGGLCFTCATRIAPGHVRLVDYGTVTLGEHDPAGRAMGITHAVARVGDDLERSGTEVVRVDDLPAARWRKLVWNVPYNGLTVVLDSGTDELQADPWSRELVLSLMQEVGTAAAACGHPLPEGFVDQMLADTDAMVPYRTSMKVDFDEGRPLEIEAIHGNVVRAARAAGADAPRIDALYHQLAYLERLRLKR